MSKAGSPCNPESLPLLRLVERWRGVNGDDPPGGPAGRAVGSGGRIRTSDLWVMSPTSCHCSTPRQGADTNGVGMCPQRPRLPHGCPCSTLRRCPGSRPGSGWDRVEPARSRPRAHPNVVSCLLRTMQRQSSDRPHRAHHEASTMRDEDGSRSLRPLGRVSSSRLPAVHPAPINPVVSRGSLEIKLRGVSSWRRIPA